jgi:hypothetical protein
VHVSEADDQKLADRWHPCCGVRPSSSPAVHHEGPSWTR